MRNERQAQRPPSRNPSDSGLAGSITEQRGTPTAAVLLENGSRFAIVGGLLLGVDAVAHLFVDDTVTATELFGLSHELWHLPGVVGIMAATFGLIAVYLRQASEAGTLGKVGFLLLFVGVSLGAGYSTVFHAVFLPALEGVRHGLFEEFIDAPATTAQLIRGITVQAVGLGLGAILFGAATIRARVLPPLGGWLMIVAALFAAANETFAAAQLVSRLLFAAAFVLLGSALRSSR